MLNNAAKTSKKGAIITAVTIKLWVVIIFLELNGTKECL